GVTTPVGGPYHLLDLFLDGRSDGRVADVGVDLHQEAAADDHRLALRVVNVGGNDCPSPGYLAPDIFGVHALPQCDVLYLRGDDALAGVVELRNGLAALASYRAT